MTTKTKTKPRSDQRQEAKSLKSLMIFPNGLLAAFDSKGAQIAELQNIDWLADVLEAISKKGYDITSAHISLTINNINHRVIPHSRREGRWTFELTHK